MIDGALIRSLLSSVRSNRVASERSNRASLVMPIGSEDRATFAARAHKLITDRNTCVYIDTSFLMSMIRSGSTARAELIRWLKEVCGDRLSVPVWASHELYRHHAHRTIPKEVSENLAKLDEAAQNSFRLFWTLFDEPLEGAPSAQAQRDEARAALTALKQVVTRARSWSTRYDLNADDVITFANEHALKNSKLFDYLQTIEPLYLARFTGRVPPGFKDERKKNIHEEADEETGGGESIVGSNRWGDLMFWKEILGNASERRAKAIVILTKDVKNDWRMAGKLPVEASEKQQLGEQPAHPFLIYEAAHQAGVSDVLLLDEKRISAIFESFNLTDGRAFVAAKQPPPSIKLKTESEVRAEIKNRGVEARAVETQVEAQREGYRFPDAPALSLSEGRLRRALVESVSSKSASVPGVAALEQLIANAIAAGTGLQSVLISKNLTDLDHVGLVSFARRLGIAAIERADWSSTVTELLGMLPTLPPNTANYIFMGLLAANYFNAEQNSFRLIPTSPFTQQLYQLQSSPFAALPIVALRRSIKRGARLPLYLADASMPIIRIRMETDADLEATSALRALWLGQQQLLTSAQGIQSLTFKKRFGANPLTPQLILDHLAELYALPRQQLLAETNVTTFFSFQEFWGFKEPRDLIADQIEENPND